MHALLIVSRLRCGCSQTWGTHAGPRLLSSRAFFQAVGSRTGVSPTPDPTPCLRSEGCTPLQDLIFARGDILHLSGRNSGETWEPELREPEGGAWLTAPAPPTPGHTAAFVNIDPELVGALKDKPGKSKVIAKSSGTSLGDGGSGQQG